MTVSFDRLWSTVMKWDLQIIALTYNNKINPESEYSWVLKKWVLKKQTLLKQTNFAQTNFRVPDRVLNFSEMQLGLDRLPSDKNLNHQISSNGVVELPHPFWQFKHWSEITLNRLRYC